MSFFDRFRRPKDPPRPIARRRESRVEFLGEQDGDIERELKPAIAEILAAFPIVQTAYLARVGFQPEARISVAICLLATAEDRQLVEQIAARFKSLFAADAFVDILFLSPDQALDVARVCQPFYARALPQQ